jgi:hypothetical protein
VCLFNLIVPAAGTALVPLVAALAALTTALIPLATLVAAALAAATLVALVPLTALAILIVSHEIVPLLFLSLISSAQFRAVASEYHHFKIIDHRLKGISAIMF